MFQEILTKVEDRVGTITLNRPEKSNAISRPTYGEIAQAVELFEKDPAVGAIVITGAGKHFSAGGDIQRFKGLIESGEYLSAEGIEYAGTMTRAIKHCKKPVIAMVNGVATGAGLSLALGCDFRVVTPKSKLIMAFVNLGLPGDTGSIYFLARLLGIDKASMMMMTGEPMGGEEAVRTGLASMLAAEDQLEATTYAFAKKLASKSSEAIGRQKELLCRYFYGELDAYYRDEAATMAEASRLPDFTEAVYAFLEKRTPEFNKGTK